MNQRRANVVPIDKRNDNDDEQARTPTGAVACLADPKEAEINQYALDWLRAVRSGEGDPFSDAAPHEVIQRMLKDIANSGERNAAFVVKMAVAEIEDAHEALADLISERNAQYRN